SPEVDTQYRLEVFLSRFSGCGRFFLEPVQFRKSLLLPGPLGHPARPAPGLIGAVYLWMHHLSFNRSQVISAEAELLSLTTQNLAHDLSAVHHPNLILHTIQAEVLLSYYYMDSARLLEGIYHCAAAVSLAWCAGINKIGAPLRKSNLRFVFSDVLSDPPDELEAAERINAFWAVLMLNNCWVAASGLSSNIPDDIGEVCTPWPTEGMLPQAPSGYPTVAQFLSGEDHPDGLSGSALAVKASILLERVHESFIIAPPTTHFDSGPFDLDQFDILTYRLETFQKSLPKLVHSVSAGPEFQTTLVTRCLTNVATIRLHEQRNPKCGKSIDKACMAAGRLVSDVNEARILEWQYADPMLGVSITQVSIVVFLIQTYSP
ncbi:hypothetical protein B0H13DRAFT_1601927, partial [Mycena leptocephala]